jgi:membrane dipeptidase
MTGKTLVTQPVPMSVRAAALLADAVAWDNHGCMPIRPMDEAFLPELTRYRAAGFTVASLNVGFGSDSVESHLRMLASLRSWVQRHVDHYRLVQTVADIHAAKASGQLAVVFDIEGMGAVADQPELVNVYSALGVRWMLVAYNQNNRAGGGCHDEDGGLTDFGRRVIAQMNACGMLVCCSHTGERTALEVMAESQAPVLLTHSNAQAVFQHPRNVSDRLLRACAATGGVVGLNGLGIFLGDNDASVPRFMRHLRHVVDTIGPQHVGLGLDYVFDQQEMDDWLASPSNTWPPGYGYVPGVRMLPPEVLPELVDAMLALGWRDADVRGVVGGNWLRVAEQVWR